MTATLEPLVETEQDPPTPPPSPWRRGADAVARVVDRVVPVVMRDTARPGAALGRRLGAVPRRRPVLLRPDPEGLHQRHGPRLAVRRHRCRPDRSSTAPTGSSTSRRRPSARCPPSGPCCSASKTGTTICSSLPIVLIGGPAIGALIDIVHHAALRRAPRLITTVVTIGVAQGLAAIGFFIPVWIGAEAGRIPGVPTPWDGFAWRGADSKPILTGNQLAAFAVGDRSSRWPWARSSGTPGSGIALRASAENADRAALLGIPVKRVGTVAWMLAGPAGRRSHLRPGPADRRSQRRHPRLRRPALRTGGSGGGAAWRASASPCSPAPGSAS